LAFLHCLDEGGAPESHLRGRVVVAGRDVIRAQHEYHQIERGV
jgi:hypothetical protein